MKVAELIPKAINKCEFHESKIKFLPKIAGCYVITTFFDDVLYIGLTINLRRRIKQHLDNSHKNQITELGKGHFLYYCIVNKEFEITKLERGWLNQFELAEGKLPILNSVHSPIT